MTEPNRFGTPEASRFGGTGPTGPGDSDDRWRASDRVEPPPFFTTPPASPGPTPPSPAAPPSNPYAAPATQETSRFGGPAFPLPAHPPAYPPPADGSPASPPAAYPSAYGPPSYPPAYGSPAHSPGPQMYPAAIALRSNKGLGTALVVLGACWTFLVIVRALAAPAAIRAYDAYDVRLALGVQPGSLLTAHDALALLLVPVEIATWVVASIWLWRAHANAFAFAGKHLRHGRVWCWLGWWVPIVAYWFPKQMLDDSWKVAATQIPDRPHTRHRGTGLWWGLWIAFQTVSVLASLRLEYGTFDRTADGTVSSQPMGSFGYGTHHGVHVWLEALAALLCVAAYLAWVVVVRASSQAQDALASRYHAARSVF